MADIKPPRLAGDERSTVHALLDYQRRSLVRKVRGVGEDDAARVLVPSGMSLIWLVTHIAGAETSWLSVRFAGQAAKGGERPATLAAAIAHYEDTWVASDEIVAAAGDLDATCRGDDPTLEPVNLRWILVHLLEETARHAGHADILVEQLDGRTGR